MVGLGVGDIHCLSQALNYRQLLYKGSSFLIPWFLVEEIKTQRNWVFHTSSHSNLLAGVKECIHPGASCSLRCPASSLLKDLHEALKYRAYDFQGWCVCFWVSLCVREHVLNVPRLWVFEHRCFLTCSWLLALPLFWVLLVQPVLPWPEHLPYFVGFVNLTSVFHASFERAWNIFVLFNADWAHKRCFINDFPWGHK